MDASHEQDLRLDAELRVADARLDAMEAAARAHNAQPEIDEVSGLRAARDRIRQAIADAKVEFRGDRDAARRALDADWAKLRASLGVAHARYSDWDAVREKIFNAHLDEADAYLRESAAADRQVAVDARVDAARVRDDLRNRLDAARRSYAEWRERQRDAQAKRNLDDAEWALDEALARYDAALGDVAKRRPERAD